MKYYLDTSVLVAYYCPEVMSDQVQDFLSNQAKPAVSFLTEVELTSAIARKVRMGDLGQSDGNRILSKFLSHLDSDLFSITPVEVHHWRIARGWISLFSTPLRTLDALHLAIVDIPATFANESGVSFQPIRIIVPIIPGIAPILL